MRKSVITIAYMLLVILLLSGCTQEMTGTSYYKNPEETKTEAPTDSEEEPEEEQKSEEVHLKLSVPGSGVDVFTPRSRDYQDYRYGPSIMLEEDGTINAWFSSTGDGVNEFDWITHRSSEDGGITWGRETIALKPTPGSMDTLSVCDPDVFFHDGYYYIGYTSTVNDAYNGMCNSMFLARSEKPEGPFEKWNGSGWGGDPEPVIYYDGVGVGWGVGEPAFVLVDDVIYIYVTRDSYSLDYSRIKTTQVYTADITDELWPARPVYQGCCVVRTDSTPEDDVEYAYADCDSWDVAYLEQYQKFIAVCTNRRFTEDSSILYYESTDGISFDRVSEINMNVLCRCHNCGIMGDKDAHIKEGDEALIGYAYAGSNNSSWGVWATRFAPLKIETTDEPDRSEESEENMKEPLVFGSSYSQAHENEENIPERKDISYRVGVKKLLSATEEYYISLASPYAVAFRPLVLLSDGGVSEPNTEEYSSMGLEFTSENEAVCDIGPDGVLYPVSEGEAYIRADMGSLSRKIKVTVGE